MKLRVYVIMYILFTHIPNEEMGDEFHIKISSLSSIVTNQGFHTTI